MKITKKIRSQENKYIGSNNVECFQKPKKT